MCGRFGFFSSPKEVRDIFPIKNTDFQLEVNYNIAPGNIVSVIKSNYYLTKSKWGFIPHWVKDKQTFKPLINARCETVGDKPSFRSAFKTNRCLIIADYFYEWKKEGKQKTPHLFRLKTKHPFAFAGLYEKSDSKEITCLIITTEANTLMAPIHSRMPLILCKEKQKLWLDQNADLNNLKTYFTPFQPALMDCHEVSAVINNPSNNIAPSGIMAPGYLPGFRHEVF